MTTEDNPAAKILLETRDLCRTQEWAFEDYKKAKIDAYRGVWKEYKKDKAQNSKLLKMLQEKYRKHD